MFDLPESAILFSDSAHGVYIPQHFAETVDWNAVDNWNEDQRDILLSGPDHEMYWDVWTEILDGAYLSGGYTLYQDGDLWLVPSDWTPED